MGQVEVETAAATAVICLDSLVSSLAQKFAIQPLCKSVGLFGFFGATRKKCLKNKFCLVKKWWKKLRTKERERKDAIVAYSPIPSTSSLHRHTQKGALIDDFDCSKNWNSRMMFQSTF